MPELNQNLQEYAVIHLYPVVSTIQMQQAEMRITCIVQSLVTPHVEGYIHKHSHTHARTHPHKHIQYVWTVGGSIHIYITTNSWLL